VKVDFFLLRHDLRREIIASATEVDFVVSVLIEATEET